MTVSSPSLSACLRIVRLALPLSAIQLAQVAISTTDIVLLGWHGEASVAAGALGFTVFNLLRTMGFGLVIGTANLVAEHGKPAVPANYLLASGAIAIVAGILAAVLATCSGPLLVLVGQDAQTAASAARYLAFIAPGYLPLFLFYAYRGIAVGRRQPRVLVIITLAVVVLNAVLDYGFLFGRFGFPEIGVAGVALSSALSFLVQAIALAAYTHKTTEFDRNGAERFSNAVRRLLAMGCPTAAAYGSEAGFTAAITLLVGAFGVAALAAHAVVNQLVYIIFMVSIGLSHATSVSVSEAVGKNDRNRALREGRSGLITGFVVALVSSAVLLAFPQTILSWFALTPFNAGDTFLLALSLIPIAALCQIADFLQNIGIGSVRAVGRAGLGFWVTIVCYWGLGLPAAWALGWWLSLGVQGVWSGMGLGLAAAACGMIAVFERALSPGATSRAAA